MLVVSFSHMSKGRGSFWKCKCDCSKTTIVSRNGLTTGSIKSCGCLSRDRTLETHVLPNGQGCLNRLYNYYRQNAKAKDRVFDLTREQFKLLVDSNCFYCGESPKNTIKSRTSGQDYRYNGIDRKDNDMGYTMFNCVSCCKICNQAKHDLTYEAFISWIETIAKFRKLY